MARSPSRGPPLSPNSSLSLHTVPYQTVVCRSNLGKHTFTSTSLKRTPKNRVQPRSPPINTSDPPNWHARSVFVNCDVVIGLETGIFVVSFLFVWRAQWHLNWARSRRCRWILATLPAGTVPGARKWTCRTPRHRVRRATALSRSSPRKAEKVRHNEAFDVGRD